MDGKSLWEERSEQGGWVVRKGAVGVENFSKRWGVFSAVTVKMASCIVPRAAPQEACCQTWSSAAPSLTGVSTVALKDFSLSFCLDSFPRVCGESWLYCLMCAVFKQGSGSASHPLDSFVCVSDFKTYLCTWKLK